MFVKKKNKKLFYFVAQRLFCFMKYWIYIYVFFHENKGTTVFEDVRRLVCWLATEAVWMLRGRCELPVVSELVLHQKKKEVFLSLLSCSLWSSQWVRSPVEVLPGPSAPDNRGSIWGVCGLQASTIPAVCVNTAAAVQLWTLFTTTMHFLFVWIEALLWLRLLSEGQILLDGSAGAWWHYHQSCPELDNVFQYWVKGQHMRSTSRPMLGETELMFIACCSQSLQNESCI